ncbi:MAG: proline racemase family protein [Gordonia sp. (in: high G+C Gram-positive bacteria)]|uniref:proline racemase family protein n=1 Tax=Gordonia sp. (in: high G+C Gram-positive bacteria) TaxID=84139 RepID=UPI0039E516C2
MTPSTVSAVDYHTGGEPFRIVVDVPEIVGTTVAARRITAIDDPAVDGLRRLLCFEPRGHADMYGGFLVPPDDDGAHFGVLFWHKDGFSTACGHGTIALGAWAVSTGRVPADPSGVTDVVIDVPSGRVTARVHSDAGRVSAVEFVNVPSYVLHRDVPVDTSRGPVEADVTYGGALYAQVDARTLGLEVVPGDLDALIALGREVKAALTGTRYAEHPSDRRLSGIYGTVFYTDDGFGDDGNPRQRNVTIFADGQVDRSPCGSGTSARVATLAARGALDADHELIHRSIVDSVFRARIAEAGTTEGHPSVTPVVVGTAYQTGEHVFTVDPDDDLVPGFVLR